ncbi:MAG: Ig-like domain-containing protein, partial [Saprospiraceae bacterium]|nr:Ig-like domain-containing protein [Saprospiraceae bacterium]
LSGFFTVHDILQQAGTVERFIADFTQHCESETNPPLTGRLSINARHPSVPAAAAGADILAAPSQTLSLDGGNSTDDGSIAAYQWSVDHPDMTLLNANQSAAQLVTPDMTGGETTIAATVTLTVTDDQGFKDQDSLQVTVEQNNAAPVANDDHIQFSHKRGVTFNPLSNDFDPDGSLDSTSLEIVTAPQNGTVQVFNDGRIHYLPNHPSIKTDSMIYRVRDNLGVLSQPATIHLTR